MLLLLLAPLASRGINVEESKEEKARQQELKKEADLNLLRLKKSIEEDGFYSARVALNIWRSTAIDAGTFDQDQFDEFKRKLYQKSINQSLECIEYFMQEEDYYDANICLQTWKIHSEEIGTFDQSEYDALKERLNQARAKKFSEEDKKRKPSD